MFGDIGPLDANLNDDVDEFSFDFDFDFDLDNNSDNGGGDERDDRDYDAFGMPTISHNLNVPSSSSVSSASPQFLSTGISSDRHLPTHTSLATSSSSTTPQVSITTSTIPPKPSSPFNRS